MYMILESRKNALVMHVVCNLKDNQVQVEIW
jgi:hypothetical protein